MPPASRRREEPNSDTTSTSSSSSGSANTSAGTTDDSSIVSATGRRIDGDRTDPRPAHATHGTPSTLQPGDTRSNNANTAFTSTSAREPMDIESGRTVPARQRPSQPPSSSSSRGECVSEEAAGKLLVLGSALCCVGILLILILVPLSFSYIEWDSVGFKRDKVKNIVYADKVYTTGRYFWGVGKSAFTFPKVYQHISFKDGEGDEYEGPLAIFTKSGVEVQLEISMQYRLIPDQLEQLYEKYGKVYHQQVVNIARAAIKNTAPNFTVDDYIRRRQNITATFHLAVSTALEEVHVEVPSRKLQLRAMDFPPQIGERYLVAATEIQANQAKQFQQKASLVRKETDRLVSLTRANTTAVRLESSGNVGRIAKEAEAEAERIVRTAEGSGIDLVFRTLGITTPELKKEFLRLQAIASDSKILLGVKSAIINVAS